MTATAAVEVRAASLRPEGKAGGGPARDALASSPFAAASSGGEREVDEQGSTSDPGPRAAPGPGPASGSPPAAGPLTEARGSLGACSHVSEWRGEPLESAWLTRVQGRAAELRAVFRLPGTEVPPSYILLACPRFLIPGVALGACSRRTFAARDQDLHTKPSQ